MLTDDAQDEENVFAAAFSLSLPLIDSFEILMHDFESELEHNICKGICFVSILFKKKTNNF